MEKPNFELPDNDKKGFFEKTKKLAGMAVLGASVVIGGESPVEAQTITTTNVENIHNVETFSPRDVDEAKKFVKDIFARKSDDDKSINSIKDEILSEISVFALLLKSDFNNTIRSGTVDHKDKMRAKALIKLAIESIAVEELSKDDGKLSASELKAFKTEAKVHLYRAVFIDMLEKDGDQIQNIKLPNAELAAERSKYLEAEVEIEKQQILNTLDNRIDSLKQQLELMRSSGYIVIDLEKTLIELEKNRFSIMSNAQQSR